MLDANKLYLPDEDGLRHKPNIATANGLQVKFDACVVEPLPYRKKLAGFELSQVASGRLRPDAGILIAKGPDCDLEIDPGDCVLLRADRGNVFHNFSCGEYVSTTTKGEVRIYGTTTISEDRPTWEGGEGGIVGKIKYKTIVPVGVWCLIKRDSVVSSKYGLELPDSLKNRNRKATVVSVGNKAAWSPGQRVLYHGPAIVIDFDFTKGYDLPGDPTDYCLIRSTDIHLAFEEKDGEGD